MNPEIREFLEKITKDPSNELGILNITVNGVIFTKILIASSDEIDTDIIIIYNTHMVKLLLEDFNISYLFTNTEPKLLIKKEIKKEFVKNIDEIFSKLPEGSLEKIMTEALILQRIIDRIAVEASEKAALELLEEESSAKSKSKKAKAFKKGEVAKKVIVKEGSLDESSFVYDDDEEELYPDNSFVKRKSAAPVSSSALAAAAVSSSAPIAAAAVSSSALAAAAVSSLEKKRRPSPFISYNLNHAIISQIHNMFSNKIFFKSLINRYTNLPVFLFFNILKNRDDRNCMHLTIGINGIHMTLESIRDNKNIRHIHLNLVYSKSERKVKINTDEGYPITPEYISTTFTSALENKAAGGAGRAAAASAGISDFSNCNFEEKSNDLLMFLDYMINICVGTGALVLSTERAGGNYYDKYMKYKTKYLKLKQLIFNEIQ